MSVSKGTTILNEEPFAFIVRKEKRRKLCNFCLNRLPKPWCCSECRYVYYCDTDCRNKAWPLHQIECKSLLNPSSEFDDAAWLMARVIIKLNQGGSNETCSVETPSGTYSRKFNDLQSHTPYTQNDAERMQRFKSLRSILRQFLDSAKMPKYSDEELLDIYGKVCLNSICMVNVKSDSQDGTGIYLKASVLNHSCEPDVIPIFKGTTIIVRTLKDLPSLDWSKLKLSYFDVMEINKPETLYKYLYFRCDCGLCKRLEPKAAACPNSSCDSPCLIETDECEKCGAKLLEGFKEEFREVTNFTTNQLEQITIPYDDVKECLEKQKGILHKYNLHRILTLESAFYNAKKKQLWNDTVSYGKERELGHVFYYGEVSPKLAQLYIIMAKIYCNLEDLSRALEALGKAYTIITIIYGNELSVLTCEFLHTAHTTFTNLVSRYKDKKT